MGICKYTLKNDFRRQCIAGLKILTKLIGDRPLGNSIGVLLGWHAHPMLEGVSGPEVRRLPTGPVHWGMV